MEGLLGDIAVWAVFSFSGAVLLKTYICTLRGPSVDVHTFASASISNQFKICTTKSPAYGLCHSVVLCEFVHA